jgi:citrate lyase alpha subunit
MLVAFCFLGPIFQESKEQKMIEKLRHFQAFNYTPLSRQNRALKLGHNRVCNTNCYANLGFSEADIQAKLDTIVGSLLIDGQFKVCLVFKGIDCWNLVVENVVKRPNYLPCMLRESEL